ncbi:MAG: hypothetical protein JXQ93_03575 [Flavobacteriaceae bacterium]
MLTTKEQLEFCKKCENKTLDLKVGVICSLTNAKPNFGDSCKDFTVDSVEVQKMVAREILTNEAAEAIKMPVWQIVLSVIIALVALVRLVMAFS